MSGKSYRIELEDSARVLAEGARTAFGELLGTIPWEWYTTHTFKAPHVSHRQADNDWYAWFNSLRLTAKGAGLCTHYYGQGAPYYFRCTERQERGTLHFHSLIAGVGNIRRLLFKDMWEMEGYARVEKYDPGKGANFYVGKYLTKAEDFGDITFSHTLENILKGLDKL
jgi:hypothetical protein